MLSRNVNSFDVVGIVIFVIKWLSPVPSFVLGGLPEPWGPHGGVRALLLGSCGVPGGLRSCWIGAWEPLDLSGPRPTRGHQGASRPFPSLPAYRSLVAPVPPEGPWAAPGSPQRPLGGARGKRSRGPLMASCGPADGELQGLPSLEPAGP